MRGMTVGPNSGSDAERTSVSIWPGSDGIYKKLEDVSSDGIPCSDKLEQAALALLFGSAEASIGAAGKGSFAINTEDCEHAFQTFVMDRLDIGDDASLQQIIVAFELLHRVVVEVFQRGTAASEFDSHLRSWLVLYLNAAEEFAKVIPLGIMASFIKSLSRTLPTLRSAYLQFGKKQLAIYDAPPAAGPDTEGGAPKAATPPTSEERCKFIVKIGINGNSPFYLNAMAVLKQLHMRLNVSGTEDLRVSIIWLLENLLPMDHKAIANMSKGKADFVTENDVEREASDHSDQPTAAPVDAAAPAAEPPAKKPKLAEPSDA